MAQVKSKNSPAQKFIDDFKFIQVGAIKIKKSDKEGEKAFVEFDLSDSKDDASKSRVLDGKGVYLWVQAEGGIRTDIIYIGMAGTTLAKRFKQQENGANGRPNGANKRPGTGSKNGDELRRRLRGRRVTLLLFAQGPMKMEVFKNETITSCAATEQVLIAIAQQRGLKPKVGTWPPRKNEPDQT